MVAIRSVDEIASKWATVTPSRSADFKRGIENPKASWQGGALAANDSWKDGVQQAIQEDRFKKGVAKTSDSDWQTATLQKGVNRWGPGVSLAQDKFTKGFAPYQSALSSLKLPPRYARRDPRNLDRVKAVVDAMTKVKAGQS